MCLHHKSDKDVILCCCVIFSLIKNVDNSYMPLTENLIFYESASESTHIHQIQIAKWRSKVMSWNSWRTFFLAFFSLQQYDEFQQLKMWNKILISLVYKPLPCMDTNVMTIYLSTIHYYSLRTLSVVSGLNEFCLPTATPLPPIILTSFVGNGINDLCQYLNPEIIILLQ